MYSDFNNQLLNIFRCGFAFSIVYLLWPFFLFNDRQLSLDGFVSRYAKMVFLTIVLGYVLIVLKLYEVISLVAIFFFLSLYKATNGGLWRRKSKVSANRGINWFFDLLDGQVHIGGTIRKGLNRFAFVFQQVLFNNFGSFVAVANSLLFAAVFLFSSYLRFYDAIMHAAPAMSDAYVTLAWMKYMDQRLLFHDGIYPQGFHIYLSIIRKFATNDHLYILKYIGPMNTVLITLGLYFFILKITKQILPAIMAAFVFGVLGGSITGIEWSRQVSTNSQEFALVFLLPAWYFILSYLQSSNKSYLWTAFVCCGIIGLVHTIVFLFLIIGVVLLIFSHLLLDFKKSLLPVLNIALAGIAAGFLSVIPVLGGFLMGRSFHSASVEFLNNELKINFPIISLFDQISLAGILLFFIVSLFWGKSKKDFIVPLFLFLLLIVSFGMHMTLGPLTSKAVLSARSGVLWGILSPLGFGLGWYGITRIIPNFRKKMILEIIIFSIVISYAVFTIKPVPAEPYKMEYDSVVEQYLRISEEFRPTEWIIVSNEEGYSLAMGKGYHMMLGDFIKDYSPEDVHLSRRISGKVEMLTTPDIFIFKEKKMLQVKITGAENALDIIYNRRAREYSALDIWLEKYRIKHKNMTVYYEDQNIQVFQIHQPKTKKALFEELWEGR